MAVNKLTTAFRCEYNEPYTGRPYGFLVHADNEAACKDILNRLDMQTRLLGVRQGRGDQHRIHTWAHKTERKFAEQLPRVLHHTAFVGHMVSRYCSPEPHQGLLVCDTGIVHVLAHRLLFRDEYGDDPDICMETCRDVIVNKITNYEMFVPWMWPGEER